jgi:hypothetical protein
MHNPGLTLLLFVAVFCLGHNASQLPRLKRHKLLDGAPMVFGEMAVSLVFVILYLTLGWYR